LNAVIKQKALATLKHHTQKPPPKQKTTTIQPKVPREQGEMQKNVKPTLPASHLSALLFHDEVPLSKDSFPHCPTIVRLLSISIVTISLKLKRAVNKSS